VRPPVFISAHRRRAMTRDVTAQEIERNAKWAERWEKVRAFGRWRFLLLRGVVGWAVPWGVLMLVWAWWYIGQPPTLRIVLTTSSLRLQAVLSLALTRGGAPTADTGSGSPVSRTPLPAFLSNRTAMFFVPHGNLSVARSTAASPRPTSPPTSPAMPTAS
jgi:hypothetical protein